MPNNDIHAAWRNFINACREEAGRTVAGDPVFSKLFEEFQGAIDGLVSTLQGGVAASPRSTGEMVNLLERLRSLNDALLAAVEENFYLAGLKDGVAVGQMLVIHEGEDDYLQDTLDDHLTMVTEIAREYGENTLQAS
jgi:hypothetical protein